VTLSTADETSAGGGDAIAIGADTFLFGDPPDTEARGGVQVFVRDVDREGLRDEIDPCPRDPVNHKNCKRDTIASPGVDHLLSVDDLQTAPDGKDVVIIETVTNTSNEVIRNPFAYVTFSGNGSVLNGDGDRKEGSGSTISPDVGDGVLSPGKHKTVREELRQQGKKTTAVKINVHGNVEP